ncbi:hypothetical protein CARUB_v10025129mg, partial [Capsella rubella]
VLVPYVDKLLKLENSSIGKVVGKRLRDLDVFELELEVAVEGTMNEGEEVGSLSKNVVSELLKKLMVLSFKHLESYPKAGRLDESFENLVLNTRKLNVSQVCTYPENCGVKFASKLLDIYLSGNNPQVTM